MKAKTKYIDSIERFVTKVQWKALVTEKINQQVLNAQFRDVFLEETLSYHPNPEKINGDIKYLVVCTDFYNARTLFFMDDEKYDSISYNACITHALGMAPMSSHKTNVQKAFRTAISQGSIDFLHKSLDKQGYGTCQFCTDTFTTKTQNPNVNHIQVDHIVSFQSIFMEFTDTNNINRDTIQIKRDIINGYEITNDGLKDAWINYHDNQAKYQLLCRTCNIKKGANPN